MRSTLLRPMLAGSLLFAALAGLAPLAGRRAGYGHVAGR